MDVAVEGASIGTIGIATDGTFTFATTGGTAQSVAAGEALTITAPASADATAADIAVTLAAALAWRHVRQALLQGRRAGRLRGRRWLSFIHGPEPIRPCPHESGIADPFNGHIDEFSIAHVLRSDGWIETTWSNMSDPGAFAAAGAEEQEGGEPPLLAGTGVVVCLMA